MKISIKFSLLWMIGLQVYSMQGQAFNQSDLEQMIEGRYQRSFAQFYLGSIDPVAMEHWRTLMKEVILFAKHNITLDKPLSALVDKFENHNNIVLIFMEDWNKMIKQGMGTSATAQESASLLTPLIDDLMHMQSSPALNKSYMLSGNNQAAKMVLNVIQKLIAMAKMTQSQLNVYKANF